MSTAHLPYLPLNVVSVQESKWFLSAEPDVVRAGIYLLDAAWRSSVPGSVPSSFTALRQITRLSESQLRDGYELLTQGWELREDGRLYHPALFDLATSVTERFGDQIEVLAQSAVVAMQSVDTFDLVPTDAVHKVARKRQAAKGRIEDFMPDATSLASIVSGGYRSDEHQQWLVCAFRDYVSSKNPKYRDVQATFRTFASSSYTHQTFRSRFGALPSDYLRTAVAVGQSRAVGGAVRSFQERTLDANREVLSQVRAGVSQAGVARSSPGQAPMRAPGASPMGAGGTAFRPRAQHQSAPVESGSAPLFSSSRS